jgi:ribosomal protein L11 methyltransferase
MTSDAQKAASIPRFGRFELRAATREAAERALALAVEAGASGAEECDENPAIRWILYADEACAAAVRDAAARALGAPGALGEWQPEPEVDWPETWKRGLDAIDVSPRLRVRPPFIASAGDARREVVIDPGQAFGTGAHSSTWLALAALDRCCERGAAPKHMLDIGTGSGVLALAALELFPAAKAFGFDLDPLAAPAARANAELNALSPRLALFTGGLDALARAPRFDALIANLLRREHEPLIPELAPRLLPDALCIFSGLIASDAEAVSRALAAHAIEVSDELARTDADGERWIALIARRRA